ncbi:CDP-alcohol phosphatidyltransferase family protein [Pedobacter psychroterrae]|uniref:CDP-alcohol phosphatidyltransferase family protein n=1 Tax=Pedobacter psychroterrae TaxID=2530453 RepID=A0A4R0NLB9_9SPHI|nr:CDP-alcohol phosphatidyltransferase family protein [Pedobacter psychroterrae]TCD00979.1 CDP-alcohol phosphatidyltransferase family protein [Pedobacter psychroterrae]
MEESKTLKRIFQDRKRTNVLKSAEQATISYLVKKVPSFITSNMLTFLGTVGSVIVLISFILAAYISKEYLVIGVAGLAINWLGDSLDGRIAYFRNTPRKWFGFSLDIIMDWVSTVLIGMGYMVYARNQYELIAFVFVALYGWAMIISQLRYKITDIYSIDSGLVGPTEVRVILSLIFIMEASFGHLIEYFAGVMCLVLFIINIIDTRKLLKLGDTRDDAERAAKLAKEKAV